VVMVPYSSETTIREARHARVGVGGGHGALDDAELLVEDLGEGREAVGGARGVGDDGRLGVEVAVVDGHHVGGDPAALGGRGDEDLLGARLEVLPGARLVDEHAGALDHAGGAGELTLDPPTASPGGLPQAGFRGIQFLKPAQYVYRNFQ
jgi:hypothetical protein